MRDLHQSPYTTWSCTITFLYNHGFFNNDYLFSSVLKNEIHLYTDNRTNIYQNSKKLVLIIQIFIVFGISEFTFWQNGRANNYPDRHGLFLLPGRMFYPFVEF